MIGRDTTLALQDSVRFTDLVLAVLFGSGSSRVNETATTISSPSANETGWPPWRNWSKEIP